MNPNHRPLHLPGDPPLPMDSPPPVNPPLPVGPLPAENPPMPTEPPLPLGPPPVYPALLSMLLPMQLDPPLPINPPLPMDPYLIPGLDFPLPPTRTRTLPLPEELPLPPPLPTEPALPVELPMPPLPVNPPMPVDLPLPVDLPMPVDPPLPQDLPLPPPRMITLPVIPLPIEPPIQVYYLQHIPQPVEHILIEAPPPPQWPRAQTPPLPESTQVGASLAHGADNEGVYYQLAIEARVMPTPTTPQPGATQRTPAASSSQNRMPNNRGRPPRIRVRTMPATRDGNSSSSMSSLDEWAALMAAYKSSDNPSDDDERPRPVTLVLRPEKRAADSTTSDRLEGISQCSESKIQRCLNCMTCIKKKLSPNVPLTTKTTSRQREIVYSSIKIVGIGISAGNPKGSYNSHQWTAFEVSYENELSWFNDFIKCDFLI